MACNDSIAQTTTLNVWTAKSDADGNALFHPSGAPENGGNVQLVRGSVELTNSSGGLKVRAAYRTSDDGITWGAPAVIGNAVLTANGTSYGNSFVDISSATNAKQWLQFGALAQNNNAGLAVEMGAVIVKIDRRKS